MPPAYVKTIREEIFYEYAKLISRSAHGSIQYGFVTDRFKKLRDGQVTISGTIRESHDLQSLDPDAGSRRSPLGGRFIKQTYGTRYMWLLWEREQELPHQCVFCGSPDNLSTDHLIPRNRGGDDSSDNLVQACTSCNSSRGDKGVFEWLGLDGTYINEELRRKN